MIGNVINDLFFQSLHYPMSSALSIILMVIILDPRRRSTCPARIGGPAVTMQGAVALEAFDDTRGRRAPRRIASATFSSASTPC